MLALFLGLIVSAGLYFAYLWPTVEPLDEPVPAAGDSAPAPEPVAGRDDAKPPAPDEVSAS